MPPASVSAARRAVVVALVAAIAVRPVRAAAQVGDSGSIAADTTPRAAAGRAAIEAGPATAEIGKPARLPGYPLHWWEGVLAAGAVAGISAADEPLRNSIQRHRSDGSDDVASVLRHVGQPEVYGSVGLGLVGIGLLAHDRGLERSGARVLASIALAYAATGGSKLVTGRSRPYESPASAFQFHPFSGHQSLPSAHATAAFALATSLADDIHSVPADVALYGLAAGTAWSRLNDDDHWLSDTVLGAAIGVASAKLVSGRWRLFRIRPPRFLISPSGAAVVAHATL
jgi:membrane-associated phospholipid phosphatase